MNICIEQNIGRGVTLKSFISLNVCKPISLKIYWILGNRGSASGSLFFSMNRALC